MWWTSSKRTQDSSTSVKKEQNHPTELWARDSGISLEKGTQEKLWKLWCAPFEHVATPSTAENASDDTKNRK